MEVMCLYRPCPNVEPYMTKFDTATGTLVDKFPWLNKLPVRELFSYADDSYVGHIRKDYYYNVMFMYPDIRLVINYKNKGFILVSDKCVWTCDIKGAFDSNIFDFKLTKDIMMADIGCVLTPVFTYDVMHPMCRIGVINFDNRLYILTRYGLRDITISHSNIINADASVRLNPAWILDNRDYKDIYALYAVDNAVYEIRLKEVN
ncbi:MAG: hypothetical protein IJE43_19480 [Alphaproteobacteria bacterium]|nr:hypothetical protein [Alphaproteobacteria bacterium]